MTARNPRRRPGTRPPALLRRLIDVAMELERRTMALYCRFESLFPEPEEVRAFWFDMAQHESRHFGALALVAGLLDSTPKRSLPAAPALTRAHVLRFQKLLADAEAETRRGLTLSRAFELTLSIEGSELEDLVLDLLSAVRGERERERAVQLLIHDLGDLSYMIEKYGDSGALLSEADRCIEQHLARLRRSRVAARARRAARPRSPA